MNSNYSIRFLKLEEFDQIIPLVSMLNPKMPREILSARLEAMKKEGFKCIGVFDQIKIIGVCGVWEQTRLYCGRIIEPDSVFIHPDYRSSGIGKLLVQFLDDYAITQGADVSELNCYVTNEQGLSFWRSNGYKDLGIHLQKKY